ncbi:MAG TPA: replication-relaxation family protein [Solirubrobacteraceae bacterium]|nr:replication-relaxation family protein [Solirubrobacteraceae bacterium]
MLRFLIWRLLGLLAVLVGFLAVGWLLSGAPGRLLRGKPGSGSNLSPDRLLGIPLRVISAAWSWAPLHSVIAAFLVGVAVSAGAVLASISLRWWARGRRRYIRLRVEPYRTDQPGADAVARMYAALHKRMLPRWWRRVAFGPATVALEVHYARADRASAESGGGRHFAWLAVTCPLGSESMVEAALRSAYPNCRLAPPPEALGAPAAATGLLSVDATGVLLRLKKDQAFIRRVKSLDRFEHEREPAMNRLLTVMGACRAPAVVQLALVPAPVWFERFARRRFKMHERRLARERAMGFIGRDRSLVDDVELRGGLDLQHRPLFFADIRVIAAERSTCELVASELRVESAENRLVERGASIRHGALRLYRRRIERGEGNPLPGFHRGVFASAELASIWHAPSIDYLTVPFARGATPLAPAPPAIFRPGRGGGTLQDAIGPVSIQVELRKQNTAVPGAVEQGKSSYLVATVAEDLRRERCSIIVLDPKGDAANAAVSLVPAARTCTLLDFAHPTCGFNPLAVDAPADVIADYVVAALKHLFSDADIRASSDRYLRNAIIAVLAFDRSSTLWDAARLLSVGEDGYAYRRTVGARVRTLPEFSEISTFFTTELTAQLADARSMTTAKLDAPVNKLARLLNSASIKRVLLNESLTVDFDRVIAGSEVLVVKGALGVMGAGNTSVLMQLLVGMLDAALARQQDRLGEQERIAVALKVDEAPLVLNRGFAETMALKRSAGLETVACWQTDAQWSDRDIRDQLDALFAHRVYFATASAREARADASLTMAEFSDTVRPGIGHISKLARPDARLHLPKHHAIASWTTTEGRQSPFVGRTLPLRVDRGVLALHAERQHERGGRYLGDLRQPNWQRRELAGPAGQEGGTAERSRGQRTTCSEAPAGQPRLAGRMRPDTREPLVNKEPPVHGAGPAVREQLADQEAPTVPAESYRELVELDRAQSVHWARPVDSPLALEPDALDLDILRLIARLSHVLSSQLHRHFNPQRAVTTTQRRLKRLSDAGLVERFQFHRRDGGGVPMCYVISRPGWEQLVSAEGEGAPSEPQTKGWSSGGERRASSRERDGSRLRQARHDVHVAGWVLALVRASGAEAALRGSEESALNPPQAGGVARRALGPADLRLPGGRVAHDFVRTGAAGIVEVDRFETIRPDATVALRAQALDVMVELDDRLPTGSGAAKLERYDHFLTGWSTHLPRYSERRRTAALLVFVCRDRSRARRCALLADAALRACRAYAGEHPLDWEYSGRRSTLFVAERDVHNGSLRGYGVPELPPAVRVEEADGDPAGAEASVERRELLA